MGPVSFCVFELTDRHLPAATAPTKGEEFQVIAKDFQDFIVPGTPVPEPTTMIAGALLLLPLGASALRILRRKATA